MKDLSKTDRQALEKKTIEIYDTINPDNDFMICILNCCSNLINICIYISRIV